MTENDFREYLFSYSFDGGRWSFSVPARSLDEAKRRIATMQMASYDGILEMRIPAVFGAGLLVRMMTWVGNAFGRRGR